MDSEIFDTVSEFISEEMRVRRSKIKPESQIEADLGITGDDADEMMAKFFEKFGVDPSGYSFNNYFHSEGWGCLVSWFQPFPKNKIPLTVKDLANRAATKRWDIET